MLLVLKMLEFLLMVFLCRLNFLCKHERFMGGIMLLKCVLFLSALISFSASAVGNKELLQSGTWQLQGTAPNGTPLTFDFTFSKRNKLTNVVTCHFSQIGFGEDVQVEISNVPLKLTNKEFTPLESHSKKLYNSSGYWCSAFTNKDYTVPYTPLSDTTMLIDGETFTLKGSEPPPPVEPPTENIDVRGKKFEFSFKSNGIQLDITQDFTKDGVLKTTAACHLAEVVRVTISAPVEVTEDTIRNTRSVVSEKKYDSRGAWCTAIIPVRTMNYKTLSEKAIFVANDPLHPDGQQWNLKN